MTKKNCQEINFGSAQDRKRKSFIHQKGMPIVRCICGSEILVIPDLKAMNIAIKNHVAEHKKEIDGSDRFEWLKQFLTQQVLIVASKENLQNVN